MNSDRRPRINFLLAFIIFVIILVGIRTGVMVNPLFFDNPTAKAQTPPQPDVKQIVLPKDQKLKDANWHCYAGGTCELWLLTKPRKSGEAPESYVYSNADGTRKYVIKEQ